MSDSPIQTKIISSTTVLILSGIVIGLATEKYIPLQLRPYLTVVGLLGILAYFVLDLAATRRKLVQLDAERELVEQRFDKHMLSLSHYGMEILKSDSIPDSADQNHDLASSA